MRPAASALSRTLGARSAGTTTRNLSRVVAVITNDENPAMKFQPKIKGVEFISGNDSKAILAHPKIKECTSVIYAFPGSTETLSEVCRSLPAVTWVHSFYAGVDALADFTSSMSSREFTLTNGRGAFSDSLAEWAIASSFYFNKQIPRIQRNRTEKKWDKFVMGTLYGKTMAFIGFGHIAQATARLAKALGVRVVALRRNPDKKSALADETHGYKTRLDVFSQADFVVCSLPGTKETDGFVGAKEFKAMKESGVFISIGRGLAVDEVALDKALTDNQIAGAALDVYRKEPLSTSSPLWEHENVLLTSHNADYTEDYFIRGWDIWKSNLDAQEEGKPWATPVDIKAGY